MTESKYVLAMYDVRGKQDFIFKTNRIKEIVGASKLIEDVFQDYLYPVSKRYNSVKKEFGNEEIGPGIFHEQEVDFTEAGFADHMGKGYIGEVVYEGGGNFLLLFRDEDIFKDITYEFTKIVKKEIGSLRILGTYVEIDNFEDFKGDRNKLYAKHAKMEEEESNIVLWPSLPIVQVDRRTSAPLTTKWNLAWGPMPDKGGKVSKDIARKYEKFFEHSKDLKGTENSEGAKILDDMVLKKGADSLLAVVYIDGNNMGKQVQDKLDKEKNYAECIAKLREFSRDIQKKYVDKPREIILKKLKEKYNQDIDKHRFVVYAGDEINFICNAHDAYDLAVTYLKSLPDNCSACAGISIFHSHAPYADAYSIAEECCESGKKFMREHGLEKTSFLDFHYCQGAIGNSLENIRKQETGEVISKPWLIVNGENENTPKNVVKKEYVDVLTEFLVELGRSNVKGLMAPAFEGEREFDFEISRIKAHMEEHKREKLFGLFEGISEDDLDKDAKRKLIYDIVTVYDIWFAPVKTEG